MNTTYIRTGSAIREDRDAYTRLCCMILNGDIVCVYENSKVCWICYGDGKPMQYHMLQVWGSGHSFQERIDYCKDTGRNAVYVGTTEITGAGVAQSVQCLSTDWTTRVRSQAEAKGTSPNAHPASYAMGKRGRGVVLTTHPI
jgi:hypothetical protein